MTFLRTIFKELTQKTEPLESFFSICVSESCFLISEKVGSSSVTVANILGVLISAETRQRSIRFFLASSELTPALRLSFCSISLKINFLAIWNYKR